MLVKNFYLEFESGNAASRWLIETRFLIKDIAEGKWCGFSYKWEADGSDAVLLEREFTEAYFVLDPEAEGGDYYGPYGFREMSGKRSGRAVASTKARNEALAKRLWDRSVELTGVDPDLPAA
mgnify:CR=1 FL=1